ncbi:MAG: cytochrome c-type biosis protein CcmH [Thermoanaerobaculia bacterium]|jgi:tetratricopeptide (TPR) repeat protein|nr:cytochrome c-type biosis protein CcmH [Thermoanaerobaculia bacterium]
MTDWLSAGGMILSGLIVGFMFWYGMKSRAPKPDVERLDLEAKRDVLLQQLRELKETGGSVEEQRRLERETADVLRALDKRKAAPSKTAAAPTPAAADVNIAALTRAASIRGFIWGAASVAVLGGIAWFVTEKATPKTETASAPMASAPQSQPQQSDPALQQIEAAVAKSPDDLEMRNQLAKAYLERENLMGVFEQTKYILARTPDDARALTYQALVRMSMGQRDPAAEMLQHAIKSDPQLLDAYVALAWDNIQRGKTAEAEAQIAEATRRHPEQKARLDDVLAKMKEQAKNPAPAAAAASTPAAAPVSGPSVHVTLTLAGAAPSPNAVLFIIARAAGQTAGPPAAVKRIAGPTFPLDIDLSAADSMMGQPLPATIRIEARIDSDGDPLTKNPSDPHAAQDGVATNGAKVSLALQ